MKYLFLLILSMGCSNVRCYDNICHTEVEWNQIGKENWAAVECMNKIFKKNAKISIEAAAKKCGRKISTSITIL